VGHLCHHVEWGVSRFITSILRVPAERRRVAHVIATVRAGSDRCLPAASPSRGRPPHLTCGAVPAGQSALTTHCAAAPCGAHSKREHGAVMAPPDWRRTCRRRSQPMLHTVSASRPPGLACLLPVLSATRPCLERLRQGRVTLTRHRHETPDPHRGHDVAAWRAIAVTGHATARGPPRGADRWCSEGPTRLSNGGTT
jgi:hypothetical protein